MKAIKPIFSILLASIWIGISEFARNTFLLHKYWVEHYRNLGFTFPEQSINGAAWGIWSVCFAVIIYFMVKKYALMKATLLSWLAGFVCMWLVIGNLGVLPFKILPIAIPLSLLETFIACFIITKFTKTTN